MTDMRDPKLRCTCGNEFPDLKSATEHMKMVDCGPCEWFDAAPSYEELRDKLTEAYEVLRKFEAMDLGYESEAWWLQREAKDCT